MTQASNQKKHFCCQFDQSPGQKNINDSKFLQKDMINVTLPPLPGVVDARIEWRRYVKPTKWALRAPMALKNVLTWFQPW